MFVNLHNHTDKGSPRDAAATIEGMAKRVAELGQPIWSITDHGSLSAQIEAYKVSQKLGLKFIFGVEGYIVDNMYVKIPDYWHICLYAKDKQGWYNIKKLVSEANINGFYYKPRFDFDILAKYSKGIVCTTACMGGLLKRDDAEEQLLKLQQIFQDDLYIEIHTNSLNGQKDYNHKVFNLGTKHNVKIIPACDAHYVYEEDAPVHREFVRKGNSSTEYYPTDDFFIHDEIQVICKLERQGFTEEQILRWINNQNVLTNSIQEFDLGFGQRHYPKISDNEFEDVRQKCLKNWYKKNLDSKVNKSVYASQVKEELDTLEKAGYLSYLLFMAEWIAWAKANNIPIGPGRGSCVGSLVCHLLGITDVDPIKYGLLFSRFCHLQRVSPPDIDVDVSKSRRDEVITHLKDTYGRDRVYQVRTFSYLAPRSALQKAAQVLNIDKEIINAITKKVDPKDKNALDKLPNDAPKGIKQLDWIDLVFIAKQLKGIVDHYGTHASAVITFPSDPIEFTSIERQGDELVAAFDFEELEELGLLKADVLGLETLDIIQGACDSVGININDIDLFDKKTSQLLSSGKTIATFQLESTGMQKVCRQIQPKSVFDVVPLVALYRPGPIESGMLDSFIRRRNGEEEVTFDIPELQEELQETYGLMVYQEDIIRVVRTVFGYTLGEADMVRRAVGKKKKEVLEKLIKEMVERGINRGLSKNIVDSITNTIIKFGEYGFNKSHAAAYGLLAYRTAYLKANYPAEFYTAALNSVLGDNKKTPAYVQAARNDGLKILPPDARNSSREWILTPDGLQAGLACISGIDNINWHDAPDLLGWLKINKPNIDGARALARVGAFESFGMNPKQALSTVEWWNIQGKEVDRCQSMINEWALKGNDKKVEEWTQKKNKALFSSPISVGDIDLNHEQIKLMGFTTRNVLIDMLSLIHI